MFGGFHDGAGFPASLLVDRPSLCQIGHWLRRPTLLHETGGTGEGAGGSCLKLANKLCPKFVSIIRLQQAEIGKEYLLNDKQRNIYICNNSIKWFD